MAFAITRLNKAHSRKQFVCGQPDFNYWFQRRSVQDDKRNIARVYVATDDEFGIVGFYSVTSMTLAIEDLPEEVGRQLPRYDAIPSVLIGRLAQDVRARGQGIAEVLLADAVRRILVASQSIAVFTIVVEAKDAAARIFYEGFGFRRFSVRQHWLFLLVSTVAAAFEQT